MRELRALFRHTGGWGRFVLLLALRCPFDALMTCFLSFFLQAIFRAVQLGSLEELYRLCALAAMVNSLLLLYNGSVWTLYATFSARWVARLRKCVLGRISRLSLQSIEAQSPGEWITRLNGDVVSATACVTQALELPHAVVGLSNLLVSSVVLLCVHPAFLCVAWLFVLPHMLINQLAIARGTTRVAKAAQERMAENTDDLRALVVCADTALLYDAQHFLLARFEESSRRLFRANFRLCRRAAMGSALLPLWGLGGYLVLLLLGGAWIASGQLDFGTLTAALQFRGGVAKGSMMFLNSCINIKAAMAGIDRVNGTLRLPVEE